MSRVINRGSSYLCLNWSLVRDLFTFVDLYLISISWLARFCSFISTKFELSQPEAVPLIRAISITTSLEAQDQVDIIAVFALMAIFPVISSVEV
jgi:hypothetical protein